MQQKNIADIQDNTEDAKSLLELVRADQIASAIRDWLKAPMPPSSTTVLAKRDTLLLGSGLLKAPLSRSSRTPSPSYSSTASPAAVSQSCVLPPSSTPSAIAG